MASRWESSASPRPGTTRTPNTRGWCRAAVTELGKGGIGCIDVEGSNPRFIPGEGPGTLTTTHKLTRDRAKELGRPLKEEEIVE